MSGSEPPSPFSVVNSMLLFSSVPSPNASIEFIVICPFASKSAFEVIISPKRHHSYFERITEGEKERLAEAFKIALNKLYKTLNDPAYNFYLHTAPCDGKNYDYYHWHWTILPKTSIWAGFELGARMEISTIEPEKAAEYLRKQ